MKRGGKIVFIYGLVFVFGYLVTGIILHYLKPKIHVLPKSFEQMLDAKSVYENFEKQDFSELDYRIQFKQNTDEKDPIDFSENYGDSNSIFCFRGNPFRNAPTRGILNQAPKKFKLIWNFTTEKDLRTTKMGTWGGGSGWTGQPLYVRWPREIARKLHGLKEEYLAEDFFEEVIQGSLCGNIYFLDPRTGKATRPHLSIHNPIKGTVSVDPRMNGLLYVGQGIQNGDRIGAYVFNMFTGKEIFFRNGIDPNARREWGAFDSNALIDIKSGYWFHPAENGQIFKTKVLNNTQIPRGTAFNYSSKKHSDLGIESSFGAWKQYGFFGDNGGNVFCLNLQNFQPIWYLDNYDDTDVSMVIDFEKENPFLYIGNEVDKQGSKGWAYIRKINAQTGKEVWSIKRECIGTTVGGRVNSGGVLASILPGKKKASDLVFGIFSRVEQSLKGEFVAINKKTGKLVYSFKMEHYSWASPIDLYDKEGNCYLFFTSVFGNIYLMNAKTGKMIYQKKMPVVWESSPIAIGNQIFLGARGDQIYSFEIE